MGKKKSSRSKTMSIRVKPSTHKKLIELVDDLADPEIDNPSAMATRLIECAIEKREEDEEQALVGLLTHFEEQLAERISTLNYNLRQATGMILTPKPKPKTQPKEKYRIDSPQDAANWVESKFRDIPE